MADGGKSGTFEFMIAPDAGDFLTTPLEGHALDMQLSFALTRIRKVDRRRRGISAGIIRVMLHRHTWS